MQRRKPLITLAVSLIIILCVTGIVLAFAGGPPTGATGSVIFNQASCAQATCHVGTANTGSGTLTLSGVPANYALGQSYTLTVTLQQTGQRRWGFQLSARARATGQSTGTLQQGLDGFSQLQTLGGIQYVAHNAAGTRAGTVTGPVSFQVRWTAPAINVGEVVFSVAGNAANNDNNNTGDFIYTREMTSQPPTVTVTPSPTANAIFIPYVVDTAAFRSNLGMSNRTTSQANVNVQFVDSSGSVVASKQYAVPPGGLNQVNNVIADLLGVSPPSNREGYLILEPTQPISAFATPIDNITQDSAVIQGARGVATRLLSPTSASVGVFKTTMTIINDSNSTNTVELRLRDSNGIVLATKTQDINPYGFFHTEDIHGFLGVSGTFGPIELTSKSAPAAPFVAVSRVYSTITTTNGFGQTSSFFSAGPF